MMRYVGGGVGHYRQAIGRTAVDMDRVEGECSLDNQHTSQTDID